MLALTGSVLNGAPLGTTFTLQARLNSSDGTPATGNVSVEFSLWDAETGGVNVGTPSALPMTVTVVRGVFTVDLNFGSLAFNGDARWVEFRVNGVVQATRTRVAPTPNAIYATTSGSVKTGAIQAGQFATLGTPKPGQILGYNGNSLVWQTAGVSSSPWLLSGANTYFSGGNVGIGTSTPTALLHVNSAATTGSVLGALLQSGLPSGGINQIYLGRTPTGNGCSTLTYSYDGETPDNSLLSLGLYNSSFTLNMRGDGNVGVGTTTPDQRLHVQGNLRVTDDIFAGRNVILSSGASESELGELRVGNVASSVGGVLLQSAPRLVVKQNGHVGIGVANPSAALEIQGNWEAGTPALQLGGHKPSIVFAGDGSTGNKSWLMHVGANGPGNMEFYKNGDSPGSWKPVMSLVNSGKFLRIEGGSGEAAYIGGDGVGNDIQVGSLNPLVTDIFMYNAANGTHMHTHVGCLTIHGGCDLAEPFPMKDESIEKGSVVVIDEAHPGELKLSSRAYDTQVAGIVSGANGVNPGIALKQEGKMDQGQNVALTGRVYVKADASYGAIKPGDLLTTSDTAGHAMKVRDHARSQGAILGKAMSVLNERTGLVLVLVTLQ